MGGTEDWSFGAGVEVPSVARMYDLLLGGRHNYDVDREAVGRLLEAYPHAQTNAIENRRLLWRVVTHLSGLGIRQFLDVGTGIPTNTPQFPNTHTVAQRVHPDARVVYVDKDPKIKRHLSSLLRGTVHGCTKFIEADMYDPEMILREAAPVLDFRQPVGLLMLAVLHFIPDDELAQRIVAKFMAALAPGSFVVITHGTADFSPRVLEAQAVYRRSGMAAEVRDKGRVEALFGGLELLEPGVVPVQEWRPDGPCAYAQEAVAVYAGVARKPSGG